MRRPDNVKLMTTNQVSFLDKAMELCNSMMQFSGCELYSHNTRPLLEGLKATINSVGDEGDSITYAKTAAITLLIDTLLEEEGIAEAEMLAGCDPEPIYDGCDGYNWDEPDYPEDPDMYGPDPMWSAEDAFAYLEEQEYSNEYDKENYLKGNTIEDMAEMEERHDNDDEIEAWANTPHEGINTELKQIDEEIADRKAAAAIKRARIAVMNKIYFENGDVYPVHSVHYELDRHGIPVDIEISTFPEYLDEIAEKHGLLGYNMSDYTEHGFNIALYGRLDRFGFVDYRGLIQYTFIPIKDSCVIQF